MHKTTTTYIHRHAKQCDAVIVMVVCAGVSPLNGTAPSLHSHPPTHTLNIITYIFLLLLLLSFFIIMTTASQTHRYSHSYTTCTHTGLCSVATSTSTTNRCCLASSCRESLHQKGTHHPPTNTYTHTLPTLLAFISKPPPINHGCPHHGQGGDLEEL